MLSVTSMAVAGQFNAEDVGIALPSWVDTFPRINHDGDVAWSQQQPSPNYGRARLFSDGGDILLSTTPGVSFATDVSDRNAANVWVAGSTAATPTLIDQKATLWRVNVNTPAVAQTVDLSTGFATPHAQTRALAVHAPTSGAMLVGGAARVRVAAEHLPKPVVWIGSGANFTPQFLSVGGNDSGVVIDVDPAANAPDGVWACGNLAPDGAYTRAHCWRVDRTSGALLESVDVLEEAGSQLNAVTSVVNRVRTLPLGLAGELETVVVGAAMREVDDVHQWAGWSYNLTTGEYVDDVGLVSGADAMAFDAVELIYAEGSGGHARGLLIGGMSSTTGRELGDPTGAQPSDANTTALHAATTRELLHGHTAAGLTCDVNDDSSAEPSTHYSQIVGLADRGARRIVRVDDKLVRLTAQPAAYAVEIRVRDTHVRTSEAQRPVSGGTGTDPEAFQYYQVEADVTSPARLRLGNALGCDQPVFADMAACEVAPAAFEIGGAGSVTVALDTVDGSRRRSAVQPGSFDAAAYRYGQLAAQSGCEISPVFATGLNVQTNPATDYDGRQWADCEAITGYDTDTQIAYDHCGACGQSAFDGLSCTTNACVAGTRTAEGDASSNQCWVNGSGWNDGSCVNDGALRPFTSSTTAGSCAPGGYTKEENLSWNHCRQAGSAITNPCAACDPSTSAEGWSAMQPRAPHYRCVIHGTNNPDYRSDYPASGDWFRRQLDNYSTPYTCSHYPEFWFDDDRGRPAETGALPANDPIGVTNTNYWQLVDDSSASVPAWPESFLSFGQALRSNQLMNSTESRSALFNGDLKRVRYLGQINSANHWLGWAGNATEQRRYHRHGDRLYYPNEVATFYLPAPTGPHDEPEEWFAFYYNDRSAGSSSGNERGQDMLAAGVFFDSDQMDIELSMHFMCRHGASGGRARMDGVRQCGPGWAAEFGTQCQTGGSGATRHSACVGTNTATSYPAWRRDVHIEGLLHCGSTGGPQQFRDDRDGWMFIRVKRKWNPNHADRVDELICPAITLRTSVFTKLAMHHNDTTPVACF